MKTKMKIPTKNYPNLIHVFNEIMDSGAYEAGSEEEQAVLVASDLLIASIGIINIFTEDPEFLEDLVEFAKTCHKG